MSLKNKLKRVDGASWIKESKRWIKDPTEMTQSFSSSMRDACRLLEASSSTPASSYSSPRRARPPRRVLYPAFQSRRALPEEAPDQAKRWLLLLSALIFLQIYTEDTHTCTDLHSQSPELASCYPSEGDGSTATSVATAWTDEVSWTLQTVLEEESEQQRMCMVL